MTCSFCGAPVSKGGRFFPEDSSYICAECWKQMPFIDMLNQSQIKKRLSRSHMEK